MFRHLFAATALAVLAVACTPAKPPETAALPAPEAPVGPQPSADLAAAFPNCSWGEVTGGGAAVFGFTCPDIALVGDTAGIDRVIKDADGKELRIPVVRLFNVAADAPLDSALTDIRAASPGPAIKTCVLEPLKDQPDTFVLAPTGAAKKAYEVFQKTGQGESMPCGRFGPSESGSVEFTKRADFPGKLVMIALPSDIAPLDLRTLKPAM